MAEALLGFVIAKLGDLAVSQVRFQFQIGIDDDIKFITGELSTMKAFLKDAEIKSFLKDAETIKSRGEVVSQWVSQVGEEVYEVEDVFEEFFVQMQLLASRRQSGCLDLKFCVSYVPNFFKQMRVHRQFHYQIEIIMRDVANIARRRVDYNLEEGEVMSTNKKETRGDYGVSLPFVEEEDIIGIDIDVEKIQNLLLNEEKEIHQQRTVISVVAMGGAGKTTLVKKVFKNVLGKFDCSAWISVSQDFRPKEVLQSILKGFCESIKDSPPTGVEGMTMIKLQEEIYKYLQDKRYILVLDDIWDDNVWEEIKHALPLTVRGRIILTTRNMSIASPIGETSHVHQLRPLSSGLAWTLFCKKAFIRNINLLVCCPENLKQTAKAIVQRCSGLPLALAVIGGLLSKVEVTDQLKWDSVLQNLDCELNENQGLERLNRALLTSYMHLPSHLKPCFLYCGMFPKDRVIDTKILVRLWVAEGFIEDHSWKSMEEVANIYLGQLIQRNMLQVDENMCRVGLVACKLHDLMRDLAIHMLWKEEFGLLLINQSKTLFSKRVRRVAIHNSSFTPSSTIATLKPRSLLIFTTDEYLPWTLHKMIMHFRLLRVLDLSTSNIKYLPSEVCELIQLRYLSLRSTHVNKLPNALCKLQSLQTFDLRNTKVVSLPSGVELAMFPQMRHFYANRGMSMKWRMEIGLKNLQTLKDVRSENNLTSQLHFSSGLRELSVCGVEEGSCMDFCAAISKMQHLRSLEISKCADIHDTLDLESISPTPPHLQKLELLVGVKECRLPRWIISLKCLQTLHLGGCNIREDLFSILAQLPNLEFLFIYKDAYLGRHLGWGKTNSTICEEGSMFPKLKSLFMIELPDLEELSTIEEGTLMPCLKYLVINNCPKLKKLPDGFQHLKSLKELLIMDMPEDFIRRLRPHRESNLVVGEDHWLIQNILKVWIRQL